MLWFLHIHHLPWATPEKWKRLLPLPSYSFQCYFLLNLQASSFSVRCPLSSLQQYIRNNQFFVFPPRMSWFLIFKDYFSPYIEFAVKVFFFLPAFVKCVTSFLASVVLDVKLVFSLSVMCYFFPCLPWRFFFLSLIFRSLILMYLGMDFFVSVLLEIYLASWICN